VEEKVRGLVCFCESFREKLIPALPFLEATSALIGVDINVHFIFLHETLCDLDKVPTDIL
jgi:hypothetical protein